VEEGGTVFSFLKILFLKSNLKKADIRLSGVMVVLWELQNISLPSSGSNNKARKETA
jgi:hypothetical protein